MSSTSRLERNATRKAAVSPLRLRWEGAFWNWHSLALVNREIARRLAALKGIDISLVPTEPAEFGHMALPELSVLAARMFAQLSGHADIHVRHFFPPRFRHPAEGHFVLVQPWEYGYLPTRWVESIQRDVSEVWCYSRYVRDVYLASGIPEEKLAVTPLGVDTNVFRPDAPPFVYTTEAGAQRMPSHGEPPFMFLYVGGTLDRKGIDVLEKAFLRAFAPDDNVVLVIKDTGTRTVYQGATNGEHLRSLARDETRPSVIYLDDDLPPAVLAGLYTSADVLVQPYRAEGFCLPVLEAMACGKPVIVTYGGPTDDFVDETVGWRVKSEKTPYGGGRIGEWDCCGPTWWFEPDVKDLGRIMREAFHDREKTKLLGIAAAARVRSAWTWDHTTATVLERMEALRRRPPLRPSPSRPRQASESAQPVNSTGSRRKSGSAVKPDTLMFRRIRPTISLCMIVRNEERVLADCLRSVMPYFDEIIVVDTGSTDGTLEILKQFGVKVYHFPWCDDFSAARNFSIDQATGDWIMWMDADDTLPEACGAAIRDLVYLAEDHVTGYLMQVHIPPRPGEYGYGVVDHVKLFRNAPKHRFEGRIHEQIMDPLYRAGATLERTNLYVDHSGYDYSPEGQSRKRERDLRILALDEADRPDHPFPRFNYGMTYYSLKEYDAAIIKLQEALDRSKPQESTVRKIYAMLAGCYHGKRDMDRARSAIETGLAKFPGDAELQFRAGNLFRDLGDFPKAERHYLTLLSSPHSMSAESIDVSMSTFKARHNLALTYQDMNRLQDAEKQWRESLRISPDFIPSWNGLGELFLRMRRFDDAQAVVEKLQSLGPGAADALQQLLDSAQRQTSM